MTYRVAFAGTPDFAIPSFCALIEDSRFEVVALLTQPDKPSGRGQKIQIKPIKKLALDNHIFVYQPAHLKDSSTQELIKGWGLDALIVAAYGLIIPENILHIPRMGCINVHGSLLPRWRGAAPVQRAIEAGDTETGVDIMQMEKGLDTGGIFYEKRCPILTGDTGESLMAKLAALGAEALMESLPKILADELSAIPQKIEGVLYAHKLTKEESHLDWHLPAEVLARRIRAFYPWPGCYFEYEGQRIKVGEASVNKKLTGEPGKILEVTPTALVIACGVEALQITKMQLPGGKMQSVINYKKSDWAGYV